MTAYREKPEILTKNSLLSPPKPADNPRTCFWFPLITVISYFVLSAIIRVASNSGSKLDQIICYGALICLVIIMLQGVRDMDQDRKAMKAEKRWWAKGCKTTLLTIVSRDEALSWWDDYSYRYRNAPNSLELEMNSDQKSVSPNQTTVRVEVSQYVYDRLEKCDAVRIYYVPESPLTFLLEEEL